MNPIKVTLYRRGWLGPAIVRWTCHSNAIEGNTLTLQETRVALEGVTIGWKAKQTLSEMLPSGAIYRVMHHDSKSNFDLQIADYCTWAIQRKWTQGDERSYRLIASVVRSEFDIFRSGTLHHY